MSYCRFSDNCYQSDVYVYGSIDDVFITHVASNRRVSDEPIPVCNENIADPGERFLKYYHDCSEWVDMAKSIPIGLPCDGKSYSDSTAQECADRLESLRAMGYNVPQHAIDSLREEDAS